MSGSGVTAGRPEGEGPLSPDQWRELDSLLDVLLDTPPERRAVLFAEASGGDPVRRAELERLVAECEREYPLLERPVASRFATLFHDDGRAMPQTLAERYETLRELGRGGMATVYLARDLKHGREVAVKIVRPEIAAALGGDRFLREIEIVAQLHHPHIVPLFDSGRVPDSTGGDGGLYYVMPYLEGRTLRERLAREGPLPVGQVVTILRDVCDALAHAHRHGIVHRDVKPDNVLLSGRHALVSDFGVARALSAAAHGTHTAAGVIVGTPTYMAPEQATGDPNVDHRADIYALGVLAYELLTGRPPFVGDTPHDIVSAHLVETPPPLTSRRPEVPLALADLVMTCLAKRPGDRWQSADDLLARLESLGPRTTPADDADRLTTSMPQEVGAIRQAAPASTRPRWPGWAIAATGLAVVAAVLWARRPPARGASPPPPPALAVLVFGHDANPESESLALGLTHSLIAALGGVPGIDVRSFAAVAPFRDGRVGADSIGHRLKVRWLVGGRVVKLADSAIVSADLIDASTGRLVARREDRTAYNDDARLIEQRLVPAVAAMLRERLGDEVRLEGWRAGTRSKAAFEEVNRADKATLDADYLAERADLPGAWTTLRRADSALAIAARADRGWVEPLIQRAWVARKIAFLLFGNGVTRDSVAAALHRGIQQAQAARRLKPEEPRALEAHGILLHSQWLIAHPVTSLSVESSEADSLLAAAESLLTAATDADPSLPRALNILGSIHFRRGNLEQARLALTRAYTADAYAEDARQVLSNLFAYTFADGDDAEAQRLCRAYEETFTTDWLGGFCRLELMAWDSTARRDADSAWRIARSAAAAAEEPIRAAATAQLEVLVAGVLARLGSADSARRVLDAVAARVSSDPTMAPEPHRRELMHLEAGVRVLLQEPDRAIGLLKDYLKDRPGLRASLARDRRFRSLPISELVDAPGRNR